jgi:hypothetical protein
MRTRLSAILGLAGLVLVTTGCVSLKRTPEARFFVLQPVAEAPAAPAGRAPVGLVGVERVRLPGHLERPQLVTWAASDELRVDEFLRWAEPLDDGLTRTLAEDLAVLLPDHQVVRRPWPGDTRTRCRVRVTVRNFGLQRDGMVKLEGRWALLPDRGDLALRQEAVSLQRGPVAGGEAGAAAAGGVDEMSGLVADVSRQIAEAIRALPPPEEEPVALEEESVTSEDVEGR